MRTKYWIGKFKEIVMEEYLPLIVMNFSCTFQKEIKAAYPDTKHKY